MKLLLIMYWAGMGEGFTSPPPQFLSEGPNSLYIIHNRMGCPKSSTNTMTKAIILLFHIPDILAILGEHKIGASYFPEPVQLPYMFRKRCSSLKGLLTDRYWVWHESVHTRPIAFLFALDPKTLHLCLIAMV